MLHEDVLLLLQEVNIPINVKNVNAPDYPGTLVSGKVQSENRNVSVCIAGSRNFKVMSLKKFGMSKILGIGARLFNILLRYDIPFEHCLSGIDSMSVVIKNPKFDLRRNEIHREEVRRSP